MPYSTRNGVEAILCFEEKLPNWAPSEDTVSRSAGQETISLKRKPSVNLDGKGRKKGVIHAITSGCILSVP